ncbi:uncharacterized protein LOC116252269 [Nymphaea colorata]|nr:uncharacterized protein LOC116252269 [Nymphaea colorata]
MEGESGHDRVEEQAQGQVQGLQAGRSSSFSELFGDKDSRTNGVFESVFSASSLPPPSSSSSSLSSSQWSSSPKGNVSSVPEESWRKDGDHQSDENTKNVSDISIQKDNGEGLNTEQVEGVESFYLSSSLYYGGRDIYTPSPTSQAPGISKFPKDGNEDDPISNNSNSASRGNWWQGSLYY